MIPEPLLRHENVALQLSGGKDSTATLLVMRPWLDRITVYWLNPGHPVPEVQEHVYRLRQMCPRFVEVAGQRDAAWQEGGWPTDLLPVNYEWFGMMARGELEKPRLQSRFSCCWRGLMQPLHNRMRADGVTLIIRGQKASDRMRGPHRSGEHADGFEFYYPIEDWDDARVYAYLQAQGQSLPASYDYITASPDCLDCTAWWGEGRSRFLQARYPEEFKKYQTRLRYIRVAIQQHLGELNSEVT